jgi:hypothetical protein
VGTYTTVQGLHREFCEDAEIDQSERDQVVRIAGTTEVERQGYTPAGDPVISWSQLTLDDILPGFKRGDYVARCLFTVAEKREHRKIQGA